MLGMYVAEGYRRDGQVVISNTEQHRFDRLEAAFAALGLPLHRSSGAVTCCSKLVSRIFGLAGDGRQGTHETGADRCLRLADPMSSRRSSPAWSTATGPPAEVARRSGPRRSALVGDVQLLFARLGLRAGSTCKATVNLPLWQVYAPDKEHKLLTAAPLPDELLRSLRAEAGLTQVDAAKRAGYSHPTDLNNLERRRGRDAVTVLDDPSTGARRYAVRWASTCAG